MVVDIAVIGTATWAFLSLVGVFVSLWKVDEDSLCVNLAELVLSSFLTYALLTAKF